VRVAVLGLGRMGTAMATALAEAGHEVTAWNRTPRTLPFSVNSMAEAIAGAEIIVVMVIDGPASQAVLDQITGSSALIVNASTVAPDESRAMAAGAGLRYLEAPVLGSVPTVRASALTVLAGGSEQDVETARPVLDVWTADGRIRHTGPVGTATALKLVANLSLGIAAAGLHDCVRLGADLGLPRDTVLDILQLGSLGGLVQRKRARLDADDYGDADFTIGALGKDLGLARSASSSELPVLDAAAELTARAPSDADLAALAASEL
jgi:3-hydroxyisobutyrate dehydrogenase